MALTGSVVAGQPILSAWGNEIRDRTMQVFASVAERDAQWSAPPNGAHCVTLDTYTVWQRIAGAWVAGPPRYGGNVQGTNNVAPNTVVTVNNFTTGAGLWGGATVGPSGITFPTAPGILSLSLYLSCPTAPAANQYIRATVVQSPGGFIQTQAFLGLTQTIGTGAALFVLDSPAYTYGCQIIHNLSAAANITASIFAFRVNP